VITHVYCLQDVIPEDKQPELLESIQRGNVSMRVMRDVFESFLNMGPLSQVRPLSVSAHSRIGYAVYAVLAHPLECCV
jgi:signal recognition particle subunit SRP54